MHPIDTLGRPIGYAWFLLGACWVLWRICRGILLDYLAVRQRRAHTAAMHQACMDRIALADRQRAMRLHPTDRSER